MPKGIGERCSYADCDSRAQNSRFHQIGEGKTTGGQDWSSLAGSVLCRACYMRFMYQGTLKRTKNRRLAESEERCTYEHCDSPNESSKFHRIEEGKTTGGQDWSSLAGSVLCRACYMRFMYQGTLERANSKRLAASAQRCTYEHCDSPEQSTQFCRIEEGKTAGGRDWSSLAGSVLCKTCYTRFLRKGTLERTMSRPLAASARRCTYEHCHRPEESRQFNQIGEGTAAGGQDWSSLVGSVLCHACYVQFKSRGTLERTLNRPLAASARRCTYEHCESPAQSSQFFQIGEGKTAGGQDWSSLVGSVLCKACYLRFERSGTLHRCDSRPSKKQKTSQTKSQAQQKHPSALDTFKRRKTSPLAASVRRCTYEHCDSPEQSSHFFQIEEGKTAGGRNWSSLAGSVLCNACYCQFKSRGTLERTRNRPLDASARRCTYEHCDSPEQSTQFFQIGVGKTTGGQDWSSIVGSVLCNACYAQFLSKGALERTKNRPLAASARRCTYEHCDRPEESRKFLKIGEGTAAGGRDWSSLAGSVLCSACYLHFTKRGTLHRCDSRPSKKQKASRPTCQHPSANGTSIPPDSSISDGESESSEQPEEEEMEDEVEDDGECMVCLGEGRAMCIVPCGHFGLCGDCGDESLFEEADISSSMKEGGCSSSRSSRREARRNEEHEEEANEEEEKKKKKKKRPFEVCPICCEEMCWPWVMTREEWVWMGGTVYDA